MRTGKIHRVPCKNRLRSCAFIEQSLRLEGDICVAHESLYAPKTSEFLDGAKGHSPQEPLPSATSALITMAADGPP